MYKLLFKDIELANQTNVYGNIKHECAHADNAERRVAKSPTTP